MDQKKTRNTLIQMDLDTQAILGIMTTMETFFCGANEGFDQVSIFKAFICVTCVTVYTCI